MPDLIAVFGLPLPWLTLAARPLASLLHRRWSMDSGSDEGDAAGSSNLLPTANLWERMINARIDAALFEEQQDAIADSSSPAITDQQLEDLQQNARRENADTESFPFVNSHAPKWIEAIKQVRALPPLSVVTISVKRDLVCEARPSAKSEHLA